MKINFVQNVIDVLRGKNKFKNRINNYSDGQFKKRQKGYKYLVLKLKLKRLLNKKIKVAFFVSDKGFFPSENVYKKMLLDEVFEAKIVVVPDNCNNLKNNSQYEDTLLYLVQKFGKESVISVLEKENPEKNSKTFDIIFVSNPNDCFLKGFNSYELKNSLLCFITNFEVTDYLYDIFKYVKSISYFWKVFVESSLAKRAYLSNSNLDENNVILTGIPRMDNYFNLKREPRERKKIFIALHQFERGTQYHFGQFLYLKDLYLKLPMLYPQIDFTIRPQTGMFQKLIRDCEISKEEMDNWLLKMENYSNVTIQNGGSYDYDFVNSDGIIQDCGAFLAEYLATYNPCCYTIIDSSIKSVFNSIGKSCLKHCYIADNEQKIINFIDEVVLKGLDSLKDERIKFVNEKLIINKGKSTLKIINHIKGEI